jgi:hypothetical protein
MGNVSNNSYSYIRSREQIAEDKSVGKQELLENKKGSLTSLKSKFANFKAMITGGEKRARATVSKPLSKESMSAELQNIRSERSHSTSTHNVKGRQSQSIKNGPPTTEQLHEPKPMDAQSLRMAITAGLIKAVKSERGSLIDKEDVTKFSRNLSISLGFEKEKLSLDQFSALGAMKLELDPFLPPDVKSNFDAVMLVVENQLKKDLGMT